MQVSFGQCAVLFRDLGRQARPTVWSRESHLPRGLHGAKCSRNGQAAAGIRQANFGGTQETRDEA